ncbi:uncharacterized protein LOC123317628 [Coccinella septempunctata]|uniref:uncharacterized protein LOC123317628 n=1 Tax=Coccinella septempunctata TaxID=41139 RepID=UPI001D06327E|nr:uncharacterized protein LOC123317628 [Coccinella septempunctata]
MVRLPLKSSIDVLGSSRQRAFRCLQALIRKFDKDPDYSLLYHQFLDEYELLQHMQPVSSEKVNSRYFLPHHGVLKTDSSTTKLRAVFNGSSPTSTGISLNDIMHTGAKLQLDVIDVLMWVRKFKFVFSTDITKMYRQILVHPDDWDLQSILWLDSNNNVKTYHLTTVTYGTRSAPFLAIRVLLQLLKDEGHNFPLAIPPLTKGRYVDDICGGADTEHQLLEIAKQLQNLCMAAGLPLAKWQSNVSSLSHVTQEEESTSTTISFDEGSHSTKVLGLIWYPQEDYFTFKMKLTKQLYMCKALWHRSQQLMAQLPTSQVQPSHPFLHTLRIESSLFAPVMGGLSSSDTGVMDCLNFLTMDNLRRPTRL